MERPVPGLPRGGLIMDEPAQTRIFGIRHHGPGCARSLLAALAAWEPDCLLVEGPPEGEDLLSFVRHLS